MLVGLLPDFRLDLDVLGIIGGLDSEDGTGEYQKFTDNADCRIADNSRRRNQEQADTGDDDTGGKAGNGHCALKTCDFVLIDRGITPELQKPAEDIKQVETRLKSEERKALKEKNKELK